MGHDIRGRGFGGEVLEHAGFGTGGRFADDETKFDFMVQVHTFGPDDGSLAGKEDGCCRLEEEEWLRRSGGGKLAYVVSEVTVNGLAPSDVSQSIHTHSFVLYTLPCGNSV